jgi:hypothetical protein
MKGAWLLLSLLTAAMMACQEDLTTPGECPQLCPGGDSEVFEITLNPLPGSDSSYMPYFQPGQGNSLLASNGLPAAEARTVYRFVPRSDSVEVRDTNRAYTVDSVLLSFNVSARDTLTDGLKLYLYRLPSTVDEGITFGDIDPAMVEANLLDSIAIPDSLNVGRVQTVFTGDELAKVALGSGEPLAVAVGVAAAQPTGVCLGSAAGGTGLHHVRHRGRARHGDGDPPAADPAGCRVQHLRRGEPAGGGHHAAHGRRCAIFARAGPIRSPAGNRGLGYDRTRHA